MTAKVPPYTTDPVMRQGFAGVTGLVGTLSGMTSSAAEDAATDFSAYVGTEPAEKMLREAGIVPTETGKQRWRERLREPIPEEALAEGERWLAEGYAEARGEAA
jgi:hypothetical protein